jgi:MmyB-like transcription regulator ligand binding domain
VALLRVEAGRNPNDRNLSDLVGELATRSDDFRIRWAGHNVRLHDHGDKRFHHPVVGDLTLSFEELPLPADPGLTITAYTAEPETASHDALSLLANWGATSTRPRNAMRCPPRTQSERAQQPLRFADRHTRRPRARMALPPSPDAPSNNH